ncbi:MAG: hypothetical protein CVV44_07525 [Spirochaetae bacterium HGW-Spirochaetae-1]|jgi:hypothetical protein|nr:MAG: hypothetical protein CVV44_07525 [Spirochaetae bacterium HGW-Spirochaetae-1]
MKKFVALTGIINITTGIAFVIPGSISLAGIEAPGSPFWLLLPALFLVFLGTILIFSSRDLERRATVVFWDGMSRVAAFFLFSWLACSSGNFVPALLGAADLLIGVIYFIAIPRVLNRGFFDILFDRN